MKKILKLFLVMLAFIGASCAYAQGNTTSSINGVVYDAQGEALPGASILATHVDSGTRYSASTDFTGDFRISNMRVGGPYKIVVTYVGFSTYEQNGVFLQQEDSSHRGP